MDFSIPFTLEQVFWAYVRPLWSWYELLDHPLNAHFGIGSWAGHLHSEVFNTKNHFEWYEGSSVPTEYTYYGRFSCALPGPASSSQPIREHITVCPLRHMKTYLVLHFLPLLLSLKLYNLILMDLWCCLHSQNVPNLPDMCKCPAADARACKWL